LSIISQEEKKVSLDHSHLLIASPEEKKVFARYEAPKRFRKFSLEGPLKQIITPNSSQKEQKDSSKYSSNSFQTEETDFLGREGAISPMRQRDSIS